MADSDQDECNLAPKSGGNGDSELTNRQFSQQLRKEAFLRSYAKFGNKSEAARSANLTIMSVYDWFKTDPKFVEAFRVADTAYIDSIQGEVRRRGRDGVADLVVSSGKVVMVGKRGSKRKKPLIRRKYSDTLLLAEAKRTNPKGYGPQETAPGGDLHIGPVQINNTQFNQLSPERIADLDELELMLVDTFKRAGLTMALPAAEAEDGDNGTEPGSTPDQGGGNGNGGG